MSVPSSNQHPVARRPPPSQPPIFNVTPAVKSLIVVLFVIHLAQHMMPDWLNQHIIAGLGFIPDRYWVLLHGDWAGPGIEIVATPITYMFLHAGWMHLGINVLSLAAFGTAVEKQAGPRFMVWLFVVCGVIGAFTEFAAAPETHEVIIGASAGVSGLFAVAFLSLAQTHNMPKSRLTVLACVIILVMAATGIAGTPGTNMPVAWISHIGGFLAGIVAERSITRVKPGNNRDIGWFIAIVSLPLLVILLNAAHYAREMH